MHEFFDDLRLARFQTHQACALSGAEWFGRPEPSRQPGRLSLDVYFASRTTRANAGRGGRYTQYAARAARTASDNGAKPRAPRTHEFIAR